MKIKLKTKTTIIFIILVSIAMTWPVFFLYTYTQSTQEKYKDNLISNNANNKLYELKRFLEIEEKRSIHNAQNQQLVQELSKNNPQVSKLNEITKTYYIEDLTSKILIFTLEGKILSSSEINTIDLFVDTNSIYFKEASQGRTSYEYDANNSTFTIASPISCMSGKICGILATQLNMNYLNTILTTNKSTCYPDAFSYMIINNEPIDSGSASELLPISEFLPIENQEDTFKFIDDSEEKQYIVQNIKDFRSLFVTIVDTSSITNEAMSNTHTLLFSSFAALVMIILLGYVLFDRLFMSFSKLQKYTIMTNLDDTKNIQLLKFKTKDDLNEITTFINKLVIKLNKYHTTTQIKLDEKTKDLEEINKKLIGRETKMIELKQTIAKLKNERKKLENKN